MNIMESATPELLLFFALNHLSAKSIADLSKDKYFFDAMDPIWSKLWERDFSSVIPFKDREQYLEACLLEFNDNVACTFGYEKLLKYESKEALEISSTNGHLHMVNRILAKFQNSEKYVRETALSLCIQNGHLPIFKVLIVGMEIYVGMSFIAAAIYNQKEIFSYLEKTYPDVCAYNDFLYYSIREGNHLDMVSYLLSKGAIVGENTLNYAKKNKVDIYNLLTEKKTKL